MQRLTHGYFVQLVLTSSCTRSSVQWLSGTFYCFLCTPPIHNYHHLDVKKQLGQTRVGLFSKTTRFLGVVTWLSTHLKLRPDSAPSQTGRP